MSEIYKAAVQPGSAATSDPAVVETVARVIADMVARGEHIARKQAAMRVCREKLPGTNRGQTGDKAGTGREFIE